MSETYIGGKLIGEGAYGCTFDNDIKCDGEISDNRIGDNSAINKLMIDSEANFEYNISKAIQFIPLNKNYFIFSTDICKPANIINQEKEKDINKCKILQGKELGDFKVLSMPYGGVSLNNFTFT